MFLWKTRSMINFDEIPDKKGIRYPRPRTVKVSPETDKLLELLDSRGKEPADFMRLAIDKAIDAAMPGEREKLRKQAARVS